MRDVSPIVGGCLSVKSKHASVFSFPIALDKEMGENGIQNAMKERLHSSPTKWQSSIPIEYIREVLGGSSLRKSHTPGLVLYTKLFVCTVPH